MTPGVSSINIRSLLAAVVTSSIVGSVVGFVASTVVNYYLFKAGVDYEMLRFTKELAKDFYSEAPLYRQIRTSIEACQDLYKPWGGKFDHDEVNQYLGFLEDLGYFYKTGTVKIEWIDHFFGAHIVEAAVHPQIIRYIDGFHAHAQESAFADFKLLSEALRKTFREREKLAKETERICSNERTQKK